LDGYGLKNKIIAYVIDEGSNLNIITSFRFQRNLLGKTFWAFFFPKLANMPLRMRNFGRALNTFP
jgi:hypothetical protein